MTESQYAAVADLTFARLERRARELAGRTYASREDAAHALSELTPARLGPPTDEELRPLGVTREAVARFVQEHPDAAARQTARLVERVQSLAPLFEHATLAAGPAWQPMTTGAAVRSALAQAPPERPVLVEVCASWAAACAELHRELATPALSGVLGRFTLLRLDVSQAPEEAEAAGPAFGSTGLPLLVAYASPRAALDGRAEPAMRITRVAPAAEIAAALARVGSASAPPAR